MGAVVSSTLQRAAALWFVTAVAGQWLFVYYISAFYGPATASGDFAAWDRNKNMTDGYLAGDGVGNLFFAAHVMAAAAVTFAGTLQLVPWIRAVPARQDLGSGSPARNGRRSGLADGGDGDRGSLHFPA
ncbi:MAG: hypothetical protein ACREXP_11415 [Steroidobacteraceae bacterium]